VAAAWRHAAEEDQDSSTGHERGAVRLELAGSRNGSTIAVPVLMTERARHPYGAVRAPVKPGLPYVTGYDMRSDRNL
jgi:hypothetical protein